MKLVLRNLVPFIKDLSIQITLNKVGESRSGRTEANTKENGKMEKLSDRALFGMQMEINMKEHGLMIKLTDMAYTFMQMVQNIRVIGKKTFSMVMEKKTGLMGHTLMANM